MRSRNWLIASAACLGAGGALLAGRVPAAITVGAALAVALLVVLFVAEKRNRYGRPVAVAYCVILIVSSVSTRAHDTALLEMLNSPYMFSLDVLQLFGFYVFPIAYIVSAVAGSVRLGEKLGQADTNT